MGFRVSMRTLVRIASFALAAVLVCMGLVIQSLGRERRYRIVLENNYARSMAELSESLTNIATDLEKSRYAGTPAQLTKLSAKIWRETGGAKEDLSLLPMGDLHLDTAYRFLSQAGDYAMALSRRVSAGEILSDEEQKNVQTLQEAAASLRDYVDDTLWKIRSGQLTPTVADFNSVNLSSPALSEGFQNLEETMTGYPTLIYDGPFSDHILSRSPAMLQNAPPVSELAAEKQAALAAALQPEELVRQDDENSVMPSYVFHARDICVGVTKSGGYVTYLTDARKIGEERLRQDAVFEHAKAYLESLGMKDMHPTYYERADGICIINYAAVQDGVILYPDLIKVGIAMDDGGVVFYDARGYLMNHKPRKLPQAALTPQEAAQGLSPVLIPQGQGRLALIPTAGQNEVLTYEFTASDRDKPSQKVLVYVNAVTGGEENILLLVKTAGGTLTK